MRVLASAAAVLTLAACDDPLAPLPDGPPAHFEFGVSSYGGDSRQWSVSGDTVVYRRVAWDWSSAPVTLRRVPTADDWRAFWSDMNDAGIRRWKGRYVAERA